MSSLELNLAFFESLINSVTWGDNEPRLVPFDADRPLLLATTKAGFEMKYFQDAEISSQYYDMVVSQARDNARRLAFIIDQDLDLAHVVPESANAKIKSDYCCSTRFVIHPMEDLLELDVFLYRIRPVCP